MLAYQDAAYVLAGGGHDGYFADVWKSTDRGVSWTSMTDEASFQPRTNAACIVHDGAMYVVGGLVSSAGAVSASAVADVWRSVDGATWVAVSQTAAFAPRSSHALQAFDGAVWMIGGTDAAGSGAPLYKSTDLAEWTLQSQPNFPSTLSYTAVAASARTMVIATGKTSSSSDTDGSKLLIVATAGMSKWEIVQPDAVPWPKRYGGALAFYADRFLLLGGEPQSADTAHVWQSKDGKSWSMEAETPGWAEHSIDGATLVGLAGMATTVVGPSLLLSGGAVTKTDFDEVWEYDACAGVACGKNEECRAGVCGCRDQFERRSGNCMPVCVPGCSEERATCEPGRCACFDEYTGPNCTQHRPGKPAPGIGPNEEKMLIVFGSAGVILLCLATCLCACANRHGVDRMTCLRYTFCWCCLCCCGQSGESDDDDDDDYQHNGYQGVSGTSYQRQQSRGGDVASPFGYSLPRREGQSPRSGNSSAHGSYAPPRVSRASVSSKLVPFAKVQPPPALLLPKRGSADASTRRRDLEQAEDDQPDDVELSRSWTVASMSLAERAENAAGTGLGMDSTVLISRDELAVYPEPVASGGFGVIYRGECRGADVAVKMLHQHLALDKARATLYTRRFEQEASIMARLNHPHLIGLRGVCLTPQFLVVTDFAKFGSLSDVLMHKSRHVTMSPLLDALPQIATAMQSLHSLRPPVVHRDLSVNNVLVFSLTDDAIHVRVTDFGLAKQVVHDKTIAAHTGFVGSPVFIAPEVLTHEAEYGREADVYSFGVIMWSMLQYLEALRTPEGRQSVEARIAMLNPYPKLHPWQVAMRVRDGLRPPTPEGAPRFMRKIMGECLSGDPKKRPNFELLARTLIDWRTLEDISGLKAQATSVPGR